jgi:glucose/mannose-6-phosphate isomerase
VTGGDALADLRAKDAADQLGDVLALPDHLSDALWRVESAGLEPFEATGLVVCGMGGSAIGGDLAQVAFGSRLSRPIKTTRGYELPSGLLPDQAVLCASYSGDTEETLACYEGAEALGARRIVATTGGQLAEAARRDGVPVIGLPAGLQPRAAVGYLFTAAAELAALIGAAPGIRTEIDSSAAHLGNFRDALVERASGVADQIEGTAPVTYGADLTAPVAFRWKTQVNENAKLPAFWAELPEADHNEIVGWEGSGDAGRFSAVFLEDRDQHPRVRQRFELTAELIEPSAAAVVRIETEGDSRTERLLWTVMLGDLVSLHLAARRGVDPSPVEVIDRLKDRLGRPS